MQPSRSHLFAAAVLALGGGLLGVTALAVAVARAVVAAGTAGVVATPHDLALLDDLVAILPFMVTFATLHVAAAIGLALGRRSAVRAGTWVAGMAVAIGLLVLVIMILGSAPTSAADAGRAGDPDGLAIISVFLCLYGAAAVALRMPAGRVSYLSPAAAAA